MGYAAFVSMAIGCALGAFAGLVFAKASIAAVSARFNVGLRTARIGAILGGTVVVFPSFFLSIVLGGTFGGGWGEIVAGKAGVVIGLAAGIAFILAIGLGIGAALGSLLAVVVRRALGSGHGS